MPLVHGGNLPYRIWEEFIAKASEGMPQEDWAKPPKLARASQRLYLPGDECLYRGATVVVPLAGSAAPAQASKRTVASTALSSPIS